jgi:hypothetical protein
MKRRQLLALGGATAAVLAAAGSAAIWWRPARLNGHLQPDTQVMLSCIAEAVLDGILPVEPAQRAAAVQQHLLRVEATVAGMPPAMQAEVDQLFTLLLAAPGRSLLFGLSTPWAQATPAALQQALQGLRASRLALRQQVFHALRDLTNAAYFADASTWAALGYPGPRVV